MFTYGLFSSCIKIRLEEDHLQGAFLFLNLCERTMRGFSVLIQWDRLGNWIPVFVVLEI